MINLLFFRTPSAAHQPASCAAVAERVARSVGKHSVCVCSPNVTQPRRLELAEIKKILDVPKECWDNSDLNKMVDALPISLFTFQNCMALFKAGLEREALYFLMFTLFHGFFRAVHSVCPHVYRLYCMDHSERDLSVL